MHTRRSALHLALSTLATSTLATVAATPAGAQISRVRLAPLQAAMAHGRFVTYQPTQLKVVNGRISPAGEASIRADLAVLRPYFDCLITYGAQGGAERIADIAAELKFRAVVIGVWNFYDAAELAKALAAARRAPALVAGLSLGNEMILSKRAAWGDLEQALDTVHKQLPGVPLTVTETFADFLDQPDAKAVFAKMDFMLVNIHPIFESWFRHAGAANWADFVARAGALLARAFAGPILVKETGIPTGPSSLNYTQAMQHDFYRALEKRLPQTARLAFSYFSAFDAPWRLSDAIVGGGLHPEEAHWGLFDANRAPKQVMHDFPPLTKLR
jgi:exo-beta-1,3-glucanase (GH17 family)